MLVVVLPLLTPGFIPTHDGEYHLIRFWQFEKMLRAGYLFPRWAPDLNSGFGVPIFNFHYPMPNYFGAVLHSLGFSLVDSFKLTLATGYLLAVFFCFIWLVRLFSPRIATVGVMLFAFVPYWFVDIYVRGSVGEVLAMAWVMGIFAAVERKSLVGLGICFGLLVLSHNITALIFLPIIVLYLLGRGRSLWPGLVWGLGLSAYFWLPAIGEAGYVTGLNTVNYQDYFPQLYQLLIPSWGSGFSGSGLSGNELSPQIGIVPLAILVGAVFFAGKTHQWRQQRLLYLFLLASLAAIVLMTPPALPVWKYIIFLPFVQYPWRFLSVLIPSVAYIGAFLFSKMKYKWLGVMVAVFGIGITYSYTRPAVYAPRSDEYYLTEKNFTDGTSSLGNSFSTRWSSAKDIRPTNKIEVVAGSVDVTPISIQPLEYIFNASVREASTIKVNTLYYPGWVVLTDGKPVPIQFEDEGVIKFNMTPGFHAVRIYFSETPLRKFADMLSVASLFWLLGSGILGVYARRNRYYSSGKRK